MHSRVRASPGLALDERNVRWATSRLLETARRNGLDRIEELNLPDLALLAHLQHHGAATPLLDVTVDPLVGLWMVAHASGDDPTSDDGDDGALFAIRRPGLGATIATLDSRPYWNADGADIAKYIRGGGVYWYAAPDISERLRIQRGSFLIGPFASDDVVTLPLEWDARRQDSGWLRRRIASIGRPGQPPRATTEVVKFIVPGVLKNDLRAWLDQRAGLTQGTIYPTPWHRPFLEEFCRGYGRNRPIDY